MSRPFFRLYRKRAPPDDESSENSGEKLERHSRFRIRRSLRPRRNFFQKKGLPKVEEYKSPGTRQTKAGRGNQQLHLQEISLQKQQSATPYKIRCARLSCFYKNLISCPFLINFLSKIQKLLAFSKKVFSKSAKNRHRKMCKPNKIWCPKDTGSKRTSPGLSFRWVVKRCFLVGVILARPLGGFFFWCIQVCKGVPGNGNVLPRVDIKCRVMSKGT